MHISFALLLQYCHKYFDFRLNSPNMIKIDLTVNTCGFPQGFITLLDTI